jgi:hypothetical protein
MQTPNEKDLPTFEPTAAWGLYQDCESARASNYSTEPDSVDPTEDGGWDDLKRVYMDCRALSVVPAEVLPLLKDQEKLSKVTNPLELVNQAKVLSQDVQHYNSKLVEIHNKHQNRNGNSRSPDELMRILQIGEEYQEWLYSYQTVVTPTVATILELFQADALEGEYIPAAKGN